jgi:uncharacterized protein YaaR (DUF327 family)
MEKVENLRINTLTNRDGARMENDIVVKLEDLIVNSEGFQELERELKYFCPFEAMGMTEQEIRHAHFLSYILDPNRPHGFGDVLLRAFLKIAVQNNFNDNIPLRPIDIHLMDLHEARIDREKDRIDLQIEIPEIRSQGKRRTILIFELKINAKEGEDQLRRYEEKVRRQNPESEVLFFFLTVAGEDPSEGNLESWTPVALGAVIDEFNKVIQRSGGDEGARRALQAYIAMMRRKHVTDQNDRLQQLVKELWAEHKEALQFLSDSQPDDVSELLVELDGSVKDLCDCLKSEMSWDFKPDPDSSSRAVILYPSVFGLLNKRSDDDRRILVLVIDRNYGDRDKLRFRWLLRPAPSQDVRKVIYEKIDGKKRAYKPEWTQIDVERVDLKNIKDLPDLQKRVAQFVKKNKERFQLLVGE